MKKNLEGGFYIFFFRFLPGGITPPHGAIPPGQNVFRTRMGKLLLTGACVTYDVTQWDVTSHECSQMYSNVFKCTQMHSNVLKCTLVISVIPRDSV